MKQQNFYFKHLGFIIIFAMITGALMGYFLPEQVHLVAPLGGLFMSLIKMLVVPLVSVSIIAGAASLGNTKSAGKIGISTFAYYMLTTVVAVSIGLALGSIFNIGSGLDLGNLTSSFSNEYADRGSTAGFWATIQGFIPENPFDALSKGFLLQILFFCLFFGFGVASLETKKKDSLIFGLNSITEALIWMVEKVMYIAPIGVFALVADAIATFGWPVFAKLLGLVGVYLIGVFIHTFIFYPVMIKCFSKLNPFKFIKSIAKAQLIAFSTASSMGTLPVTLDVCENDLDVSPETASFVLPLGATINMDGNAIYYALAALFFAQMFDVELTAASYIAIIVTATLGSIGQAGVPGPSLLVVAVLMAADIPIIGLPLLFGVDRIFDMIRTAVNITGDASCAVIVDRFSKE